MMLSTMQQNNQKHLCSGSTTTSRRAAYRSNRPGLILLVVLGMLALFSLLAVTYVVFSGQSRSASMALARAEIRGHKSRKPLMEEAVKALIRGPQINGSQDLVPMSGHDLLGDVYGSVESQQAYFVRIRNEQFNPSNGSRANMSYSANALQRPMILNNHFLRIPLEPGVDYSNPTELPAEHDVLNGRVVTFPPGSGPLSGQSFHVVRYIGRMQFFSSPNRDQQEAFAQCYSITVDLLEANLEASYSSVDFATGAPVSQSIGDWIAQFPTGTGNWASGVYACYRSVNLGTTQLSGGFRLLLNAPAFNSHGVGVLNDGSSQLSYFYDDNNLPGPNFQIINEMATALQPNYVGLTQPSPLTNSRGVLTGNAQTYNNPIYGGGVYEANSMQGILGDTDESYDAADFQNMFLSYTHEGAASSAQVIPSFHRAALINYIVNWKDPATWTQAEILATIRRIELACIRPLSIRIEVGGNLVYLSNPEFTGGNVGSALSSPNLNLVLSNWGQWSTQGWGTVSQPGPFRLWLNALTQGPWDVDNNSDGIYDSVFVDAGLPLESSADGKLLKALVAYYVEDLDSKLDVNATGNLAQADDNNYVFAGNDQYAFPLLPQDGSYSELQPSTATYLPQGFGYGPAEISFRHLLSKSPQAANAALLYRQLIQARYHPNRTTVAPFPGTNADDALSLLHRMRERRSAFVHGVLPGLPVSPSGRASLGIDRLGNPLLWNYTPVNVIYPPNPNTPGLWPQLAADAFLDETTNDPYEARLLGGDYEDTHYTLAEWERIYRVGDSDSVLMPNRLAAGFGETPENLAASTLRREITPISRHMRSPKLAGRSRFPNPSFQFNGGFEASVNNPNNPNLRRAAGESSFFVLLNSIRAMRNEQLLPEAALRTLFPLEFFRGQPMNLNRPFGNGIDDDSDGQIDESDEFLDPPRRNYIGQFTTHANSAGVTTPGILEDYFAANNFLPGQTRYPASLAALGTDPAIVFFSQPSSPQTTDPIFLGMETRQLYARHLYCLAQLIVPEDYAFPNVDKNYFADLMQRKANGGDGSPADFEYTRLRARILAQWAVNVVDFRDADNAMTRFPYDPDPFRNATLNGPDFSWDTLNGFAPNAGSFDPDDPQMGQTPYVAWGLEQPELLLTESFATHDTRVRTNDDPMQTRYDQYRIPQGSLFLELYCPLSTARAGGGGRTNQAVPGLALDPRLQGRGMYGQAAADASLNRANGDMVLNLNKLAPDGVPAWRVYISEPKSIGLTASTSPNPPELRSPNDRLMSGPWNPTANPQLPTRHDLTYQFLTGNLRPPANQDLSDSAVRDAAEVAAAYSGMIFDHTQTREQRLTQPDPAQSRVIVFARPNGNDFVPTTNNVPGIVDPESQVFFNRSGNMSLRGGEYMVIGPREVTYFGSRTDAPTINPAGPQNLPNLHRIELDGNWPSVYKADNTLIGRRATLAPCLTMIAAADTPPNAWMNTNTRAEVGISVSEPFPTDTDYYEEPSERLNSQDTDGDTAGPQPRTDALGFANLPYDAYHDYSLPGPVPSKPPFDRGQSGPLVNWDPDGDGVFNFCDTNADGSHDQDSEWAQPGTQLDWCTAYLQRLADPDKPFDAALNPYITVDWIPIDLTVFNGEDEDTTGDIYDPASDQMRFATRQKVGQSLNSRSMAFDANLTTDPITSEWVGSGRTFLSAMTDIPRENYDENIATTFLKAELFTDSANFNERPSAPDGSNAFSSLGFLNSGFELLGEGATLPVGANIGGYVGAPGLPATGGTSISIWHPDALFWPNRSFVSPLEMMWVPLSAPGQLMHEFTATRSLSNLNQESMYASAFRNTNPASNRPTSPGIAGSQPNDFPPTGGGLARSSFTPYGHLLNYFQEVPELELPALNPQAAVSNPPFPKNTALTTLFDMMETPSPWVDANQTESPELVQWKNYQAAGNFSSIQAAENIIFAPYRAPYNQFSEHVEAGRINLNTISETNVLHGIGSNVLAPNDRINIGNASVQNAAQQFTDSRRGYDYVAGFYDPGALFNPNFPTQFAGVFRSQWAAGMVPKTRVPPNLSAELTNLANRRGVLDLFARQNPAHTTLLRAKSEPNSLDSTGVRLPGSAPLFSASIFESGQQRNVIKDFLPITRLQKLTTTRSHVFAVYMTVALFEYDPATGQVGIEYGADRGEAERYRAFYVIDRSKPVGYQVGVDHNVENTILVRRYFNTND
ncbi:MAG: hypothetical protein NXI32_24960 [bacterium]|nr:hypothetical protein [bacterium]